MSWIVSAAADRARIFDLQGTEIRLLESLQHEPASAGMAEGTPAPAQRDGVAAEAFARELAEKLRHARQAGKYERLVLIAEPHVLASLSRALDEVTRRLLVASIPKDLHALGPQQLFAYLPARCVS
jgi:protein required for attachment to host cells